MGQKGRHLHTKGTMQRVWKMGKNKYFLKWAFKTKSCFILWSYWFLVGSERVIWYHILLSICKERERKKVKYEALFWWKRPVKLFTEKWIEWEMGTITISTLLEYCMKSMSDPSKPCQDADNLSSKKMILRSYTFFFSFVVWTFTTVCIFLLNFTMVLFPRNVGGLHYWSLLVCSCSEIQLN